MYIKLKKQKSPEVFKNSPFNKNTVTPEELGTLWCQMYHKYFEENLVKTVNKESS